MSARHSLIFLLTLSPWAACTCADDDDDCAPRDGDTCACDPDDDDCPAGFLCRPVDDETVCVDADNAGRIPSCTDPEGLDVFVVEADSALSVRWTVRGEVDAAGGFAVVSGSLPGDPVDRVEVGPGETGVTLRPLLNDRTVFVAVETLDANGDVTFTSCEVAALPHTLVFQPDVVLPDSGGDDREPDLAANRDGTRLYLAWQGGNTIRLATSEDFGDRWTVRDIAAGAHASIAVREAIFDEVGTLITPELAFVAFDDGGDVRLATYQPDTDVVTASVVVAAGTFPDVVTVPGAVHLAFETGAGIGLTRADDDDATFEAVTPLQGALTQSLAPSLAVDDARGRVLVGWSAVDGAGDSNVYASTDAATAVRIDDDPQGQNQSNVSVAIDPQDGLLVATWEDRRGGANVYFSRSLDAGVSWAPNIDIAVGLGGDQFRPQAVIDVVGNVYVAFQDTSNGQRVVFSRFNDEGSFDPPLSPSTRAGQGGVSGDEPTLATDRFGSVYVAWQENRDGPGLDIVFARAE